MSKILLYDIETTPLVSYTWGTFQQDVIRVKEEWYILCFAYKWLDEKKVHVVSLPDFKLYRKDPKNDAEVIKKLHSLFSEADIVIAHNGDRFDQKKTNTRTIKNKLLPPEPYKSIDTLKVARKYFQFTSNRLDALGEFLDLGRKQSHTGFDMWLGCMAGDNKSWNLMRKYNKQDIALLESVYLELLPWIENHPSLSLMDGRPEACPKCGGGPLHKGGKRKYTKVASVMRYQCRNCGGWCQVRLSEKPEVQYVN